jgi:hypothetical protein
MSSQEHQERSNVFMPRLDFCYKYNISYSTLSDRVRRGEVALHLIDQKIQINVEEALIACQPKPSRRRAPIVRDMFSM